MSGSYRRSDLGLPAPTASNAPLHDASSEVEGFSYVDHVIDNVSRVSLIVGTVNERQQVPAAPVAGIDNGGSRYGEVAATTITASSPTSAPSAPCRFRRPSSA